MLMSKFLNHFQHMHHVRGNFCVHHSPLILNFLPESSLVLLRIESKCRQIVNVDIEVSKTYSRF